MKYVEVKGISSIGTEREMNYVADENLSSIEIINRVLVSANNEYSVLWDEVSDKIIREYKDFETITSVRICET